MKTGHYFKPRKFAFKNRTTYAQAGNVTLNYDWSIMSVDAQSKRIQNLHAIFKRPHEQF